MSVAGHVCGSCGSVGVGITLSDKQMKDIQEKSPRNTAGDSSKRAGVLTAEVKFCPRRLTHTHMCSTVVVVTGKSVLF